MASVIGDNVLREAIRGGRHIFVAAVIFSFVVNLLRLTGPIFMLLIYDRVLPARSESTLVTLFLLVVVFLGVMGLLDYSRRRLLARLGAQFQERIENQIFSSTARDKFLLRTYTKPTTGMNELDNLRGFFHSSSIIAILDFVWAPMFLIVIFAFSWVLGWVVVGGLGLLVALYAIKSSFAKGRTERAQVASKDIGDLKNMILISKETLKSQEMVDSFKQRWLFARQSSRDKSIELKDWSAWFNIFSGQIRMLLRYSVLAAGTYLAINQKLSIGAMVASMFLSTRVFFPVDQFIKQVPLIRRALNDWNSLKKILASKKTEPNNIDLGDLEPSLVLSSLFARSSLTGQHVLKAINLTVQPGKIVEINGRSGSGKTVLAEIMLGVYPKSAGTIFCGGASIERLSSLQARRMFGYVPETIQFVNGTIEENISCLSVDPEMEKIVAATKFARVHEMILALPNGYRTKIDATSNSFSRGQRHQLALARALYEQPKLLIIDEPDPFLQEALSAGLLQTPGEFQSTLIVFSREPLLSFNPDQRYILENQRLKASKTVKNIIRLDKNKADKKSNKAASD